MNTRRLLLVILAVAASLSSACSRPPPNPDDSRAHDPETVTIMTFNVQNLFDNVDDPDKVDETFLPLSEKQSDAHKAGCNKIAVKSWRDECLYLDWSDEAIDHKLTVLAAAIKQVNDGRGPDIITFEEVENAAILDRLSYEYLPESKYGASILIEGDDERGIDVGFLSRLPQTEAPVLHPLKFPDHPGAQGDTRGILEATFMLPDGSELTGFAVHFPAPFHPTDMRVRAYQALDELRKALPDDRSVFAAGDFNTTSTEDAREHLLDRYVRPYWTVAQDMCKDCRGTYYYGRDDTWSFLDMILFSPARGKKTTWQIRAGSVRIANQTPDQVAPDGTPAHFDAAAGTGVSDHWPLVVEIDDKRNQ
jgi:endonuclease/exonuclease/phosphatase family metal-dependent hydrolase